MSREAGGGTEVSAPLLPLLMLSLLLLLPLLLAPLLTLRLLVAVVAANRLVNGCTVTSLVVLCLWVCWDTFGSFTVGCTSSLHTRLFLFLR